MGKERYICAGEDKEDLSEKVFKIQNLRRSSRKVIDGGSGPAQTGPLRISVRCREGHINIFEVKG